MAARPARADAQNPTPPRPPWPLLCSAVLVGMMIASEVRRAYRIPVTTVDRPETGAFGTGRSSDEPAAGQHKRAQEFGRGRHAQAPWQIPWQGWKDILWRTYYQIGEDRLLAVAAGVVFYGLLAVFPAVTALVSLYGLFARKTPAMARPPKTGPSWLDSHAHPVTHKKTNVIRTAPPATASEIRKPLESPVLDWIQRTILFCKFLSI